jgi:hypothetical protein
MARTAVKAFHGRQNFDAELGCYLRLRERGDPESIQGFWVPRLIDHDSFLMITEMQLVSPPFLIDFGKAWLDRPPSRMPPVSRADVEELFEEKTPKVMALLRTLKLQYGIHSLDPRPGNIWFGDEHSA